MKRNLLRLCCWIMMLGMIPQLSAQERFIDPVFDNVTVTSNVPYGSNFSLLPVLGGQSPLPLELPLTMDVYEPDGDTMANRPVVIISQGGDFLPPYLNLTPYGLKTDSAMVEFCMAFAKRGYVAIAMEHRIGWNPANPEEVERTKGILEASVRATQDYRTCVRFLRKHAREQGNTFRLDSTRIALGGEDAVGFAAWNVAYLDDLADAALPKFLDFRVSPPTLVVDSNLWGNIDGTKAAAFSVANHPEYSSEVSMVFSLQGGLGDFGWMEAGDPPAVGVQSLSDWNAVGIRDVTPGSTGDRLFADGAFTDTVIHQSVELGNNDVFMNANLEAHPIVARAMERSGGVQGMLVLEVPRMFGEVICDSTAGVGADSYGNNNDPWNWFEEQVFLGAWSMFNASPPPGVALCRQNLGNPNEAMQARSYINDTIATYLGAHMVLAMGISGTSLTTAIQPELKNELGFSAFPNPTQGSLFVEANEMIRSIKLIDLSGKTHKVFNGIRQSRFDINTNNLAPSMYILQVEFDRGTVNHKIIVE